MCIYLFEKTCLIIQQTFIEYVSSVEKSLKS